LERCVRFLMVLQLFFVFLSTMSIFFKCGLRTCMVMNQMNIRIVIGGHEG
jgi:hypothetical protein